MVSGSFAQLGLSLLCSHPLSLLASKSMSFSTPVKTPSSSSCASSCKELPQTWAGRLQKKRKMNSEYENLQADAQFEMLVAMLSFADKYPEDIQLLFSQVKKLEKKREAEEQSHSRYGALFSNFGTLGVVDEAVIGTWLEKHSDLSSEELLKTKEYDSKAWWQLLSAGTQIPLSWALPPALRNVAICVRFFDMRWEQTGKRLEHLKQRGGFQVSSGKINYELITFQLQWQGDMVVCITHVASGQQAKVPAGLHLSRDHAYTQWWCDQDAAAELAPMKPIKMMNFFDKPLAWGYDLITGKKKDNPIAQVITTLEEQYLQAASATSGCTHTVASQQLEQGLQQQAKKSLGEQTEKMRQRRLESVALMKEKRKLAMPASAASGQRAAAKAKAAAA